MNSTLSVEPSATVGQYKDFNIMMWYRSTLFYFWIFRAVCSITGQPKRPLPVGKWFNNNNNNNNNNNLILKSWITKFQSECGCVMTVAKINPQQENQSSFHNRKKSSGNVQKTTICNSKLPRKFLATRYGRSLPPLLSRRACILSGSFFGEKKCSVGNNY